LTPPGKNKFSGYIRVDGRGSRLALGTGNADDVGKIERVDAGGGATYRCVKW